METEQAIESFRTRTARSAPKSARSSLPGRRSSRAPLALLFAVGMCCSKVGPGVGQDAAGPHGERSARSFIQSHSIHPELMPADSVGTNIVMRRRAAGASFSFNTDRFSPIWFSRTGNQIGATPKRNLPCLKRCGASGDRRGARFANWLSLFVMATQNPIDQEGTYPLPEAQLDRFFFKVLVAIRQLPSYRSLIPHDDRCSRRAVGKVLDRDSLIELMKVVRSVTRCIAVKRLVLFDWCSPPIQD